MLNAKAIILVGARDFGRCPLASRLPTALWPVVGRPALERLLAHLADQGIRKAVICSTGEGPLLAESICADSRLELKFFDELLPVGTAGCIRDAAGDQTDTLLVVFPANITRPPEIDELMTAHRRGKSDLTVMLNPLCEESTRRERASGVYVCNSDIVRHIPEAGFSDIKESLIPEMLRAKKTIHAAELSHDAGSFRDRQGYLRAIAGYIDNSAQLDSDLEPGLSGQSQDVWVGANARIDPGARVFGPAIIMEGASISSGAVILGPTVLEEKAVVGENSVVASSVLWSGAEVGPNCQIERAVIDRDSTVHDDSIIQAKVVSSAYTKRRCPSALLAGIYPLVLLRNLLCRMLKPGRDSARVLQHKLRPQLETIDERLPDWARFSRKTVLTSLASVALLVAFFWSYRSGLADLWELWQKSDEYSSGLLVPFLAVYILWARRSDIGRCPVKPSAWGLLAFVAAQMVRFLGLYFNYSAAERLSIVLTIAALILLLLGWQLFRKVSTILLFICLMLPWPNLVQYYVGQNLQRYATSSAVFCLEMVGYEIVREGNVIHIGDASVAVAEACNGLRMITAFFVISGLVALLVNRAWWEKLIILVSSLPIALLCNTVRLAITAIFFTVLEGEHWEQIFHDFGGYAMMPLALAAIVAELWLLTKLTVLPAQDEAIIITRQSK
jgi:exosortase